MKKQPTGCKYYLHYDLMGAYESGIREHPQIDMKALANRLKFATLQSEAVSIGDCWLFVVESDDPWLVKEFPPYITVLGFPNRISNQSMAPKNKI